MRRTVFNVRKPNRGIHAGNPEHVERQLTGVLLPSIPAQNPPMPIRVTKAATRTRDSSSLRLGFLTWVSRPVRKVVRMSDTADCVHFLAGPRARTRLPTATNSACFSLGTP